MIQGRITSSAAVTCCLVIAVIGCGRRHIGATATGIVTIDGKPAPAGIRVDFQPQGSSGSPSMGITDGTGRYELMFTSSVRGVIPGECLVRVSPFLRMGADGIPKTSDSLAGIHIPDRYGRGSTHIYVVRPGRNEINIDIETGSRGP